MGKFDAAFEPDRARVLVEALYTYAEEIHKIAESITDNEETRMAYIREWDLALELYFVAVKDYQEKRAAQAEKERKLEEAKLPEYIKNGICNKDEKTICNLGYACDGCPYLPEVKQ